MPDTQHLLLFVAAGLLLNLTPGPDVLYIVGNALRSGARAGVVAALGINAGCFVHIFAAAVGVSALLAASVTAFNVLKWAGAAYLVWVGMKLLLSRSSKRWGCLTPVRLRAASQCSIAGAPPPAYEDANRTSMSAIFRGGFLTNALNPKVAIFFLAFVPQFIAPATEHKALAFLGLGAIFNIDSVFVNALWALAAAWVARTRAVQRSLGWLDRVAGLMFLGFGLKLALSDNPTR